MIKTRTYSCQWGLKTCLIFLNSLVDICSSIIINSLHSDIFLKTRLPIIYNVNISIFSHLRDVFLTGSVERDRAAPVSPVEGYVDVGVTSDLLEEKRSDGAPVTEGCVKRGSRPRPTQSRRVVIDAIRQSLLTPLTCSDALRLTYSTLQYIC